MKSGIVRGPWAHRLRRSYLFVPGSRPDRIEKALAAGADAVIVDLEDAVPPADKARARRQVAARFARRDLAAPGLPRTATSEVLIRINNLRTRAGLADLLAMVDAAAGGTPGWHGLLLPKIDGPGDVAIAAGLLDEAGLPGVLGALIETCEGLARVMEIAAAPRLAFLMIGGADLAAELGIDLGGDLGREALAHARGQIVHAAARFCLDAVEMPWLDLADEEGHRRDTLLSLALGFAGRAAIHPRQIATIHAALAPSAGAVDRAERVVAAFAAAAGGACTLDGRLVERPVVLAAQRTLALAGRPSEQG